MNSSPMFFPIFIISEFGICRIFIVLNFKYVIWYLRCCDHCNKYGFLVFQLSEMFLNFLMECTVWEVKIRCFEIYLCISKPICFKRPRRGIFYQYASFIYGQTKQTVNRYSSSPKQFSIEMANHTITHKISRRLALCHKTTSSAHC